VIFDTNITEKVGNQKMLYFLTSALPGEMKKDKNSILSLKCCAVALPDFNQLLA